MKCAIHHAVNLQVRETVTVSNVAININRPQDDAPHNMGYEYPLSVKKSRCYIPSQHLLALSRGLKST